MTTAKDQLRASIALTHAIAIAERVLQADKCNPAYTLADLRDDNERGIYIDAAASFLLDPVGREERTQLLNQTRAHGFALAEDENESIARMARRDIERYGDPLLAKFMRTDPRHCAICGEQLITNAVDVLLSSGGSYKGRAHGLCCARNELRFEFVNEFTYQLLEARRG